MQVGRNRGRTDGALPGRRDPRRGQRFAHSAALRRQPDGARNHRRVAGQLQHGESRKDPRRRCALSRAIAREANCGFLMLPNPLALIAEITHRCPLHCVYCSNPLQMAGPETELETAEWVRVFEQAAEMGVLHVHLTGGEPLARADLVELVSSANRKELYTNLITSGIGLKPERLKALVDAGLDHLQLSFQDSREEAANWIAGTKAH